MPGGRDSARETCTAVGGGCDVSSRGLAAAGNRHCLLFMGVRFGCCMPTVCSGLEAARATTCGLVAEQPMLRWTSCVHGCMAIRLQDGWWRIRFRRLGRDRCAACAEKHAAASSRGAGSKLRMLGVLELSCLKLQPRHACSLLVTCTGMYVNFCEWTSGNTCAMKTSKPRPL